MPDTESGSIPAWMGLFPDKRGECVDSPVALDQACVDLVYAAPDHDSLARRMESRNGIHTLENAEAIGLGSRTYQLVDIG